MRSFAAAALVVEIDAPVGVTEYPTIDLEAP